MMTRALRLLIGVSLLATLTACNFTKLAANQTVNVLKEASRSFDTEHDPWLARAAATSNLKFFEGVLEATPENEDLMVMIAKNYSLYAFAFTQADMEAADEGSERYNVLKWRAMDFFQRSRKYAAMRMSQDFDDFAGALRAVDDSRIDQILAEADDEDHVAPIYWVAFSWAGLINLNTDDPDYLADLPRVKKLMNWVKSKDASFENGGPHLFFGAMGMAIPKALGGKPEEAKKAFEAAIKITDGKYLMARFLYARYYMVETANAEGFKKLLLEIIGAPENLFPQQRLANELAKLRAKAWLAKMPELFGVDAPKTKSPDVVEPVQPDPEL